jgi:two-component system, OmpR family, sensor kinase
VDTSSDPTVTAPRARTLWLPPLMVSLLLLAVTTVLLGSVNHSIETKDRAAFESEVTRTTDAVRERGETAITLLRGAAGLFAGSVRVTRDEFRAYIGELRLRERYPGVLGIGFSERIAPADLERRVRELREQGAADFHVWPPHPREEVHSIVYIEPLDARNAAALGFDMFTDPMRRHAMALARDEGLVTASGKVILVQEIESEKQAGLLLYLPIYRGAVVPATVEARRRELRGFVFAPLRVGDLLQGVRGSGPPLLDLELYASAEPLPATLLVSTREDGLPKPVFRATRRLEQGGRTWLLRFASRPAFEAQSQRALVPWLTAASLATAALLAWLSFLQARAQRDAEIAAAQRRRNELALRASEEQACERAERLEQLYAERREEDRRKDEFLAVLAHELRNPLAPIRTALEILRRVPEGPTAQRARAVAERQVAHMVRLIDDLLDVSRISRGKIALQRERTPLTQVIDAAVETSLPLIEARRHELVRGPIDPQLELDVDPARLAQVFTNLLNNAAHYTPEGGRIEIVVQAIPQEVRVAVRDNGIGIEPQKLGEVFGLFVQAQRSPAGGGLGIGLSLAARLAEMHGGHIEAHSEGPGRGSEFVVVLPRDGPPPPQQTLAQAQEEPARSVPAGDT